MIWLHKRTSPARARPLFTFRCAGRLGVRSTLVPGDDVAGSATGCEEYTARAGVMTIARISLCMLLLLSLGYNGAHGARMLGELPWCKDVPGGISNWVCFDPPLTPLPPCDYKYQKPGIDCSTDSQNLRGPRSLRAKAVVEQLEASTVGSAAVIHVPVRKASGGEGSGRQAMKAVLPPCKDVRGGIPGWDCFDPPTTPLPPCDFKHQRAGFDCWPRDPPAPRTP